MAARRKRFGTRPSCPFRPAPFDCGGAAEKACILPPSQAAAGTTLRCSVRAAAACSARCGSRPPGPASIRARPNPGNSYPSRSSNRICPAACERERGAETVLVGAGIRRDYAPEPAQVLRRPVRVQMRVGGEPLDRAGVVRLRRTWTNRRRRCCRRWRAISPSLRPPPEAPGERDDAARNQRRRSSLPQPVSAQRSAVQAVRVVAGDMAGVPPVLARPREMAPYRRSA